MSIGIHMRLLGGMLLVLVLLLPVYTNCTEIEGPPAPTCDALSGATKNKLPLIRTVMLETGMYVGLMVLWPHAFLPREGSARQLKESWTHLPYMNYHKNFFELDDDPWVINGVFHGIFGSEIYLAGRTYGHNGLISFLYAEMASFVWEYLVEGWFHRPSLIDLVWTPFAGAALGELRFQLIQIVLRTVSSPILRNALITVLDPLGQLERSIMGCRLNCAFETATVH